MSGKKNQIVIPEDLTSLSDADLAALHAQAVEVFKGLIPEDGAAPTEESLSALNVLAEGIEALSAETGNREAAALARKESVAALSQRVMPTAAEMGETEPDPEDPNEEKEKEEPEAVVAAGSKAPLRRRRRPAINIEIANLSKKDVTDVPESKAPKAIGFAAQGAAGYEVGKPMTTLDMAKSVNSRLSGFNAAAYNLAASRKQQQTERFAIARLVREFPEDQIVQGEDAKAAVDAAIDQTRLQGQSLVASGGWCAPSETLYDLIDLSEAANLVSLPEIQVTRGGVRHAIGPDYSNIFTNSGFCYTEAEDIGSLYTEGTPNTVGTKPCFNVECFNFTDVRLGYCGVCVTAGILQQRGYPEAIEITIGAVLNAHMHRMSAAVINDMVAGSTAITWGAASEAGAAAPLLTAIDMQAMHLRATNRMSDTAVLEVVLPTWTKSMIRSDLARRLGVDLLSVSDQRIAGWFAERNVNVQYVVDWQDIATTAKASFTAPPTSVKFLLYPAAAFVKGVTDAITLENIYDSVGLGTNDYTALFTEDPYLVLKRVADTRVVTVAVEATGNTHIGTKIAPNGTYTP
jgi:hypothetical protein